MSSERIKIRDIMLRRYLRLGESHTMREVIGFLSDAHFENEGLPFLVVIAEDGGFAGVLDPRIVLEAMLEGVEQGPEAETSLLERSGVNLAKTVGHIMTRHIPQIHPDASLEEAFAFLDEMQTESIAVMEDERIIGLVTARILFEQASDLTIGALTGGVIPSSQ